MGNQIMCAQCSQMQVEDSEYEDQRMTFQMTKTRQFSHYSRDFQVEQKYNSVTMAQSNFSLSVWLIYPERLENLKDEMLAKSGRDERTSAGSYRYKETESSQTVHQQQPNVHNKIFRLGTIDLSCSVRTDEISLLYEQSIVNDTDIRTRAATTDAFIFMVDDDIDLPLSDHVVQLISKFCRKSAVVFLVAAKTVTTTSFLREPPINDLFQHGINSGSEDMHPSIVEEEKLTVPQKAGNEENVNNPGNLLDDKKVMTKERTSLQKWIKSIIDSYWNTDFVLLDFESKDTINAQLENIFTQAIYSQDLKAPKKH